MSWNVGRLPWHSRSCWRHLLTHRSHLPHLTHLPHLSHLSLWRHAFLLHLLLPLEVSSFVEAQILFVYLAQFVGSIRELLRMYAHHLRDPGPSILLRHKSVTLEAHNSRVKVLEICRTASAEGLVIEGPVVLGH